MGKRIKPFSISRLGKGRHMRARLIRIQTVLTCKNIILFKFCSKQHLGLFTSVLYALIRVPI